VCTSSESAGIKKQTYGIVVRRRFPQGRLILVVVEAEDLAINLKGRVSRICILKQL